VVVKVDLKYLSEKILFSESKIFLIRTMKENLLKKDSKHDTNGASGTISKAA
jgi:hypothetical protein